MGGSGLIITPCLRRKTNNANPELLKTAKQVLYWVLHIYHGTAYAARRHTTVKLVRRPGVQRGRRKKCKQRQHCICSGAFDRRHYDDHSAHTLAQHIVPCACATNVIVNRPRVHFQPSQATTSMAAIAEPSCSPAA